MESMKKYECVRCHRIYAYTPLSQEEYDTPPMICVECYEKLGYPVEKNDVDRD